MRFTLPLILVFSMLCAVIAEAGAPRSSPRPMPRTVSQEAAQSSDVWVNYRSTLRPRPRATQSTKTPDARSVSESQAQVDASNTYVLATTTPVYRSPRPAPRKADFARLTRGKTTAMPAETTRVASTDPTVISRAGSVCGDPRIRGVTLSPIAKNASGCGVAEPVRITSIDGISLSQAAIMDCTTAKTLAGWLTKSVRPAVGIRGGGLQSVKVAAHYSCRTGTAKKVRENIRAWQRARD